jgi:UDP-glucuronate decarboxylase
VLNLTSAITTSNTSDRLWQSLSHQSIFITGGSGLFGMWFLTALVDANNRLSTNIKATVLSRNPDNVIKLYPTIFSNPCIQLVKGDIESFDFPQTPYDYILHMATTSAKETYEGENSINKFHMLTKGTERILHFAGKCGVKRLLFTSSGVSYGEYPSEMQLVPETYLGAPDVLNTASGLGQGKRAAEFYCSYYAEQYSFDYVIGRCFSFVGAGLPLHLHYAIGNFIRDALYGDEIIVNGDGSQMRSFLDLSDLVHWLLMMLVKGQSGRIYNVGSDQAISIKDLAYLVRDVLSPNKKVSVLGAKDVNVGNFNRHWYVPNIDRAKSELGLYVWTPLESAIVKHAQLIR